MLLAKKTTVNAKPLEEGRSLVWTLLFGFGPTILLVGLFVVMMRRAAASAGGGMMGLGRSKAKRYDSSGERTTFADVAGIDEADRSSSRSSISSRTPSATDGVRCLVEGRERPRTSQMTSAMIAPQKMTIPSVITIHDPIPTSPW